MPGTWSTGDKQARVTLSGSKMVAVNSVDQTGTIGESLVDARLEGHSPVAQSVERLTVNQEVAGSSPARGANYSEAYGSLASRGSILGCGGVASSYVEPVDSCLVGTMNQMPVGIDSDLDRGVAKLIFHINGRLSVLKKPGCERVSQSVELDRPEPGLPQELLKHPPAKVVLAEGIALAVYEDPRHPAASLRKSLPAVLCSVPLQLLDEL
jgi:hypothetical protein